MKSQKILGIVNILLLLHGKEHTIYFDIILPCNVNLLENLKSRQINVCGVVKKNKKIFVIFHINKIKNREKYSSFVSGISSIFPTK